MAKHVTAQQIRQVLERAVAQLCPQWLQASRDDLVQAAMLKLLEHHHPGEGNSGFQASYLYKAAHSVLVDEIRRVQRRGEKSLEQSAQDMVAETPSPYDEAKGEGLVTTLRRCLTHMVETRAMSVTLYLQGHRVPEIARLLQWQVKQADNNVYRGLADLRKCLKQHGYQPA